MAWDDPMPGATARYRFYDNGMDIVYLTGRTSTCVPVRNRHCVVVVPYDIKRTQLFTKPTFQMVDLPQMQALKK